MAGDGPGEGEPGEYFTMWNYYDNRPILPDKVHSAYSTTPNDHKKVGAWCVNGLDHTTFLDEWVPNDEHYEIPETSEEECTIGGGDGGDGAPD